MAQMKTLNGYEIVDQTARDSITTLKNRDTKNFIINGAFKINHNGKSTYRNANSTTGYTLDGWSVTRDSLNISVKNKGITIAAMGDSYNGGTLTGTCVYGDAEANKEYSTFYLSAKGSANDVGAKIRAAFIMGTALSYKEISIRPGEFFLDNVEFNANSGDIDIVVPKGVSITLEYIQLSDTKKAFAEKSYDEYLLECKNYYPKSDDYNITNAVFPFKKYNDDSICVTIPVSDGNYSNYIKNNYKIRYFGFTSSGTVVPEQIAEIEFAYHNSFGNILVTCNVGSSNTVAYGFAYLVKNKKK